MSAQQSALFQHIVGRSEMPLDDWLNLTVIVRERRRRHFGADFLHDPPWAVLVTLARDANAGGLPIEALVSATGVSHEATRRWLEALLSRGFIEQQENQLFTLSSDSRARLNQIYSYG